MPQEFQVLQCYSCHVFQVDIVKKQPKWQCKLCHEKQSVKQIFLRGTSKDCRLLVQDCNGKRLSCNETADINIGSAMNEINVGHPGVQVAKTSKWSEFSSKSNTCSMIDNNVTTMSNVSFERQTKRRRVDKEYSHPTVDPPFCEQDEIQSDVICGQKQQSLRDLKNPANGLLHPLILPDKTGLFENSCEQNLAQCGHSLKNVPAKFDLNRSHTFDQFHRQSPLSDIAWEKDAKTSSANANGHNGREDYDGQPRRERISKSVFEDGENVNFLDDFLF